MNHQKDRRTFEDKYRPILHQMSIKQLIWLNEMVVDYVKIKEDFEYKEAIRTFNRGDKVEWERDGIIYTGQVIRTNKKTVNVAELEPPYRQWKIDAHLLDKNR